MTFSSCAQLSILRKPVLQQASVERACQKTSNQPAFDQHCQPMAKKADQCVLAEGAVPLSKHKSHAAQILLVLVWQSFLFFRSFR